MGRTREHYLNKLSFLVPLVIHPSLNHLILNYNIVIKILYIKIVIASSTPFVRS